MVSMLVFYLSRLIQRIVPSKQLFTLSLSTAQPGRGLRNRKPAPLNYGASICRHTLGRPVGWRRGEEHHMSLSLACKGNCFARREATCLGQMSCVPAYVISEPLASERECDRPKLDATRRMDGKRLEGRWHCQPLHLISTSVPGRNRVNITSIP